jgi:hypothetical protein
MFLACIACFFVSDALANVCRALLIARFILSGKELQTPPRTQRLWH